jgi:hypothetical protein
MMKLGMLFTSGAMAGAFVLSGPAAPSPVHSLNIKGCVAKTGSLDGALTKDLPKARRLIKVADAKGGYRCTLEVEGYALKDVLDHFEIAKKEKDGFDRPLDTYITVMGKDGQRALFSYSEVYFAGDGGPLVVEKARFVRPHHHKPFKAGSPDPTVFMDLGQRDRIAMQSCEACHDGQERGALSLPKGWLLVAPQDAFPGRFVENVTEISVHQVGITVSADREAAKLVTVDVPSLVGMDNVKHSVERAQYEKLPHATWTDATFGMGRGFHGMRTWEGTELATLLRPLLPAGVNPRSTCVLVTAEDGYRVLFSGAEVFASPDGRGVMLLDRINGKPLGAGTGRYHVVSRSDFYIDRDVRQVKEIRIIVPK